MTAADRWEVGSWFPLWHGGGPGWTDAPDPLRLYGSGRQALVALLRFGRETHGWRRVHVPAYYCPPVATALAEVLPVSAYDAGPGTGGQRPEPAADEVVLSVSYFGDAPLAPVRRGAGLIVDATHDPAAGRYGEPEPDWVFASLRKTLPLPDGGAVWSPRGHPLPPEAPTTVAQRAAVCGILSAMALKADYLAGAGGDSVKAAYLALHAAGEAELESAPVGGPSEYTRHLLASAPIHEWRQRRHGNAQLLVASLGSLPAVAVTAHRYGVVLWFDSAARRDITRRTLIGQRVYPAVLWPMAAGAAPEHLRDRADRMLFLHTDHRWDADDMRRVARIVRASVDVPGVRPGPHVLPAPARPVPATEGALEC
ncbi:hypothetical protein ONA70_05820 [Micromonospora yasonensis]|uniref:hypothetical protein n=1 Tax=Micromonospora yasonensis TaxID=1128667 RepID=UPI002230A4AB|nr:hypothetical protein [Micromonospora yasonensis]MCW3839610.1 hypothetical protein [Micromonospora yasonensis]